MDEKQFEELWVKAEAGSHAERLAAEYPVWQRRRKQRVTLACTVAVLAVAGITVFNLPFTTPKGCDDVCCNRSGIPDDHWVTVASNTLIREVL